MIKNKSAYEVLCTKYQAPVNIHILIDALGWDYIKGRSFLDDIALTKRSVKSILGFSSGVIPSILTGKYPQEHKHWSLYFYSPKTSPFRWTKALSWLPKKVLNSRVSRKIVEEISKRMMGYSGYFETYLIPVEKLYLYDICESRDIYAPKGIGEVESIFDALKEKKIEYRSWNYPLKDKEIFEKAKNSLSNRESTYYFLYLSELDALLHKACHDKAKVNEAIDYYEKQVREIYEITKEKYEEVNLSVFSDHSMATVNDSFNLEEEIDSLGFEMPKDYIAFHDSTMARFWFFNPKAKDAVVELLNSKKFGRILGNDELERLGVKFKDNMYGETIFLMNTGFVINPSFMGSKVPQGMHGYGVDDGVMDAVLVSSKLIDTEIKDVKDFFKLMSTPILSTKYYPAVGSAFGGTPPSTKCDRRGALRTKVLYFLNSTVRGGAEEHVLRLIEGLNKEQFEPILVCPQTLIDLIKPDLEKLQIKTYPVCIRKWTSIREMSKFMKILKTENPDIVHSHLFFATMFAAPIAKLVGVPKVIETAHIREAWRKGLKKAYFIDRFFYRFVDKIIAVSNAVKKYLVDEKGIAEDKIEVIYNGVDLSKFTPAKAGDRSLGSGTSPLAIGVIGRLEPQKGHKYFLEAVKLLGDKADGATFSVIGEGSLRNELENMSRDLGINDRVKFLGFRSDIRNIIAQLDLLVLPSLYEGLPLVALEAGAMGKPMVVTDVDGSSEAVINKKTGYIVASKDSQALRNAMEEFLSNRNMAAEFGMNGIKNIEEKFDIRKQITQTDRLYKSILLWR